MLANLHHQKFLRKPLFLLFAFALAATLGFLAVANMIKTGALTTAGFNPGNIMSDYVMSNYNSMSEAEIQGFLFSKNSCDDTRTWRTGNNVGYFSESDPRSWHVIGGHYVCMAEESFNGESAAHIIWQAAQDYHINPQVLIVLLEKEQSLITDTYPNSIQYRKATGYGCPDTAACDSQYFGFKNQVRWAASHFHRVLTGEKRSTKYHIGESYVQYSPTCAGTTINIQNLATVALYIYTPYQPNAAALAGGGDGCSAYGNRNFYSYFTEWFGSTQTTISINSTHLPDGEYMFKTTAGLSLGFEQSDNRAQALLLNTDESSNQQKFRLIRENNYYRIQHIGSGRYLDLDGASAFNGSKVQLWDYGNTCAQRWTIEILSDQTYRIRSACSLSKSLDVNGGTISTAGTHVGLWDNFNTDAQSWVITNVSTPIIDNNSVYTMTTTGGRALALVNESTANSTKIITGEPHSATTEQFRFIRLTDGTYRILNVASGRSIDLDGANIANGTPVQLWDNSASCAQRWIAERNGDGYRFRSACSGTSLDVSGAWVSSDNIKIGIWDSHNGDAQRFYLKSPQGQLVADGYYNIKSRLATQYALDIDGGGTPYDGVNARLWYYNGSNSQKFQLSYDQSTGYYTVKNVFSSRNLDVGGASTDTGANVWAWTQNNSCAQKWIITDPEGNHSYKLLSGCSRKALDVNGAIAAADTNVQIWDNSSSLAQKWEFSSTSASNQLVSDGIYTITSALDSNMRLSLDGTESIKNGTNINLQPQSDTDSQKFRLTYNSISGTYTIYNLAAARSLDVCGAESANGTNVYVWSTFPGTCAQMWHLVDEGNGYYRLVSLCGGGMSLDVAGGTALAGTNVWLWTSSTHNAQKWKLNQV